MSDELHDDTKFVVGLAGFLSRSPDHESKVKYDSRDGVWTVELSAPDWPTRAAGHSSTSVLEAFQIALQVGRM